MKPEPREGVTADPHEELRLISMEEQLGVRSRAIVEEIVAGSAPGHERDEFLSRSHEYHEDKAVRHLMTARLMRRGDIPPDAEGARGHLHRAITRLAMADRCLEEKERTNC